MDEQVNYLVGKAWARYQTLPPNQRLLIAISGIPGSGKTTLATIVTLRLNALASATSFSTSDIASYVPMDGYHLTRAQLSAMPDPDYAHFRRGAAFTFDGPGFLSLVQALRLPLTSTSPTLYAPSFDHAIKDPVEDDIPIPPTSRIIVFEGLYLSLNKQPWNEIAALMDERWFVDVDEKTASLRLVPRHVKAGIVADETSAWKRVSETDLLNAREIVQNRVKVDEVLISREDPAWKPVEA